MAHLFMRLLENFNPPAPCGAGPWPAGPARPSRWDFNPPAPCGAGPGKPGGQNHDPGDFNPPAPCGAGLQVIMTGAIFSYFNPPAPCGAGQKDLPIRIGSIDISIHPPRAGRDGTNQDQDRDNQISIHPPRAGRDLPGTDAQQQACISIHPPRAGRDNAVKSQLVTLNGFQSTRPVRGGTT